ncbi:MAG: hypothetical protein M2R45_04665 [Verrucomicrobia subdivision 3 bacterium]|nr:hypothetical protein [Limisphaerales bacterium]MCS1416587.1 hypothetical protein [Limisphaerales bacterium]
MPPCFSAVTPAECYGRTRDFSRPQLGAFPNQSDNFLTFHEKSHLAPLVKIPAPGSPQAITLIELLVVVALLALLFALTVPALNTAVGVAKKVECLNHLKQWGIATQLYALNNDDFLPQDGSPNGITIEAGWYVSLPKEIGIPTYHELPWRTNPAIKIPKTIWLCPANKRRSNGINLFHYCLNRLVNGSGTGNQVKLSSISAPHTLVWLFDNGKRAAVAQENNVHTNLHSNGANFLFLDGHASHFVNRHYWDFSKNRGIIDNATLRWQRK